MTSVELVDQYLARVAAYDKKGPHLNSIVRVNENARAQAVLDEERKNSGARLCCTESLYKKIITTPRIFQLLVLRLH